MIGDITEGGMRAPLSPLMYFRRSARVYADRTAVIDGEVRFTYREFATRCESLAAGLSELGVQAGARVAVLSPNTYRALECYYSVPLAGGVLVPLNTRLAAEDYRYILGNSGAAVLLADPTFAELALSLRRAVPDLQVVLLGDADARGTDRDPGAGKPILTSEELLGWQTAKGGGASDQPLPDLFELDEDAVISLNYTSGTTARPKGAMLTHRSTALNALDFILHGGLTINDIYLHTLPMFHVNGWGGVWAVTAVGATHVCLPRPEPAAMVQLIDSLRVTMACCAPTVLVMLGSDPATANWRSSHAVRWFVGGAPPPAALIRRMEDELGFEITHVYGLSETSPWLTVCEWRDEWDGLSLEERARKKAQQGVGQLLTGEVRVARVDLTEVDADGSEIGEIVVRGPTVMKGYYKDPDATGEAFAGRWFHTGDLAVLHPDGYIELVDRMKDTIVSGGENVSSIEVEGILYQHPGVLEAAVVAAPDPVWGETPVAFVVPRPEATLSGQELIEFCRDQMAHFKAPKRIELVDALPKTATGKIQKFVLRQQVKGGD